MIAAFIRKPIQKPKKLQPDCPVRLYSYMCSVEQRSGAHCVQLRFVNCAAKQVDSLFLRIRGVGTNGDICYTMESVPLASCYAQPRTVFGERRRLSLPSIAVAELEITVEWVLFSDGMLWKRLPSHRFDSPEDLGMVRCACGMWNEADADHCSFCIHPVASSAPLQNTQTEMKLTEGEYLSVPELSMEELESMMQETAAVLRSMQEEGESVAEEDDDGSAVIEEEIPNKGNHTIWILVCIMVVLALVTAGVLYSKGYFG